MNSLGTRIAVIISVALFSLLLAAGWIIDRQLNRAFMEKNLFHMEMHAQSLLSSLKTLMLNGQGALAREWLDTMRADEDVLAIDILRRDGRPAFSDQSTIEAVNAYLGERRFQAGKTVHPVKEPDATAAFRQALQGRLAFDQSRAAQLTVYAPIRSEPACNTCHGYDDADLRGVFKLSLVSSQNQAQLMEIREELWRIAIALVILLGIILWLALHYGVIRPVRRLRDAIVAVGQGDHETRLPALRHDELGEVGRVFNRMQDQVLETENRARAVMDNVADAILILDEHGEIKTANPAVRTLFGYETDELAGEKLTRLIAEDDGDLVASFLEAGHPGRSGDEQEAVGQRKDGARFPVALSISDMKVGRQHYRIAIIRDITVHKEQVQALEHQALHDDLTGLPNRVLLADRVEHAILSARRNQSSLALLLTDLDHFKEINDTLGHHYGDLILKQVAQRMQKLVRSSDTVARLGGDEFAILLPTADREQARRIVEKMIKAIEQPFELQGKTYILGSSTGIALYPEHGEDGSILLQRADVAMYLAKREHLGYAV
ncbi:MAG TPA: diguanylate cyclase, partial [Chromatiales bacterium]|nr:diguanylate cyclase [Chromatiales bacterium]